MDSVALIGVAEDGCSLDGKHELRTQRDRCGMRGWRWIARYGGIDSNVKCARTGSALRDGMQRELLTDDGRGRRAGT